MKTINLQSSLQKHLKYASLTQHNSSWIGVIKRNEGGYFAENYFKEGENVRESLDLVLT